MQHADHVSLAGTGDTPHFRALPPLGLYIHIPWCLRKCPYCDFNSHQRTEGADGLPEATYVQALLADLEFALPSIWGRRVSTVFFGGGTPSLFSPDAIDAVLAGVRARLPLSPDAEITLEANPGTFEQARFRGFREAGINRLSLGVQSFDARFLSALGRVHDENEARAAAEAAITLFPEVNLDLMYALPDQGLDDARRDVAAAVALRPTHLSFYHLTLEPNTLFHRYPPPLPDDEAAADIEEAVHADLSGAGYEHYETSAFALPGHRCRHNLNYWRFGDYLGIGAGAHSKLSFPNRIVRELRYKQPQQYMDQALAEQPILETHEVSANEVGFEFMLNALRLTEGVPAALFEERTGRPLTLVQGALERAEQKGLLARDHLHIRPTPLGARFLNDLQAMFLESDRSPARKAIPIHSAPGAGT